MLCPAAITYLKRASGEEELPLHKVAIPPGLPGLLCASCTDPASRVDQE